MSLWWVQKSQLDEDQRNLIENLPLRESFLVLGSAGSGKTNVLLRRAQFMRSEQMPNVLLLTFTRPLTEFLKTGCYDDQDREIFPPRLVTTLESWLRKLHEMHKKDRPAQSSDLTDYKRSLATSASEFQPGAKLPKYDAIFVDEAQDLLEEEVAVIRRWSDVLFFTGDTCQKIYEGEGLAAVRQVIASDHERVLRFHYRVAPEICRVADRILVPHNGEPLETTCLYKGPSPATVRMRSRLSRESQLDQVVQRLREQTRVYADLIQAGDRLGVIVARTADRDVVLAAIDEDNQLQGKAKIIRSTQGGDGYEPSFDPTCPIGILTTKGCKGLEFRAVHWLFADELEHRLEPEDYYTVVTRAKTSLDVYSTGALPEVLARAHSEHGVPQW